LPLVEYYRADHLDDDVWLATSGTYGDLAMVRRKIGEFLDEYAEFDDYIPAA
jgi:20S proteasome alpha/beta subunit